MSTRHFPYFYPRIEPQPIWSTLIDFPAISSVTYVRSLETFIQQWLQNDAQRLDDVSHHLWLVCFCIAMSLCSMKQSTLPQGVQMLNEQELLNTVFEFNTKSALPVSVYS